jgi:hypothetical protein
MSHYPIVLLPTEIDRLKDERPPIPTLDIPAPQPLQIEPPKPVSKSIVVVQATAVTIPSTALISQKITGLGLFIFLAGMGAIAARTWQKFKNYARLKGSYERQLAARDEEIAEYQQKKRWHEEESQTPERIAEFQFKLLLEILKRTIPHDGTDSKAQRGRSEYSFKEQLRQYFPDRIQTGLTLTIPDYPHPYTPDFAYIDEELNLYVDLEIDEPYYKRKKYKQKKLTHYVGAIKDERRNNFFLNKGWIVIRFSEEQAVCHPASCCKTIDRVIAGVTRRSIDSRFDSIPDLQPQKQWTIETAKQMADEDYRDKYKI